MLERCGPDLSPKWGLSGPRGAAIPARGSAAINTEPLRRAVASEHRLRSAEKREVDTQAAYAKVVRDFVESLGERAKIDISQITKSDGARIRDEVLRRTSVANANKAAVRLGFRF